MRKNIYQGEVIKNQDVNDSGLIYVRIPEIDQNISDDNLAPCIPLHNFQFFRVLPKVGERVKIIFEREFDSDIRLNQEKRYWASIAISDFRNIKYDPFYFTSNSNDTNGWIAPFPLNQEANIGKLLLTEDDIQIRGRNNTDLLFKDNEVILRAGRHLSDQPTQFNNEDPSYIQLKYKNNEAIDSLDEDNFEYVNEIIPTKHVIFLSTSNLGSLIKIVDINTSDVIETYSKTYNITDELISDVKLKINEFQIKYPNWELKTQSENFINLPKSFNNIIRVKKQIKDNRSKNTNPSVVNIVGTKINFISAKSNYNLTGSESGAIDESVQFSINKNAQRLPNGEDMLELIGLLREVLLSHVHPYSGLPAVNDENIKRLRLFDLNKILNDDIRLI